MSAFLEDRWVLDLGLDPGEPSDAERGVLPRAFLADPEVFWAGVRCILSVI
jgi:hypothetical protein